MVWLPPDVLPLVEPVNCSHAVLLFVIVIGNSFVPLKVKLPDVFISGFISNDTVLVFRLDPFWVTFTVFDMLPVFTVITAVRVAALGLVPVAL